MISKGNRSSLPVARARAWTAAALAGLTASPAATLAAPAETSAIEEIVVTAQKREERLQDVPISIAVISAEALESFQLNETTDLQYLVPGLSLTNGAGPRNFGFFVRGIGTSSFSSESIEGSVAYILDGVVLGQAGASLTDLPDVERIEVLRGPQGTLFGKNASAGVINVTTRRPADEFTAKGSLSWADPYNERKASALLSGPISDSLRFLISGRVNQRDGYITNLADGRKLNDRDDYGVRGKLEFAPSDDLTVTVSGDYWKRDAECCIWTLRSTGPTPSPGEGISLRAGIVPSPDNERQNVNGPVFTDTVSYGSSAQVDYSFGGHTLTSITAWRRWETRDGLDSDSSTLNILDVNFADFEQRQWTQELRLVSPQNQLVDYVAGVFYFDSDVQAQSTQLFPTVPLPFVNKIVNNDATTRNAAVFGQANINLTDDFRVIIGGRLLQEKVTAEKRRRDPRNNLTSSSQADKSDDAVVWRGGLQFDFTDDVMAFATATRGYKGGGFDHNVGLATLPDVKPEEPTSYEIGVRSAWLNQRLVMNLTAFTTEVDNYQVSARDPVTAVYYIRNGEAETQGVEFDFTALPLAERELLINISGAYTDGTWGNFPNAACYNGQTAAQGCVGGQQNVSGRQMPFAPEWTFNGALHYGLPIAAAYALSFDVGASYRSRVGIGFPNNPNTVHSAYTLLNGAIGFGAADDSWKLSVFGKNLTDEHYAAVMFDTPLGGPLGISQFIPYEARRIVGLSLDVAF